MNSGHKAGVQWSMVVGLLCAAALLWLGQGAPQRLLAALASAALCAGLWRLRGQAMMPASEWQNFYAQERQLEETVQTQEARLVAAGESFKDEVLERQWTGQALEHQLRYANTIINSIGEPLLVISKACNITRVNPATLQATGFAEPEIISKPLYQVLRPAFENMTLKNDPLPPALQEGRELLDRTGYLVNKAGQITPVTFSLYPLRDQGKVVAGVILLRMPPKPSPKTSGTRA